MNQKIADMAQEMEDQRSSHRAQLAAKDDEIKRLLDELTNQVRKNYVVYLVEIGYLRQVVSIKYQVMNAYSIITKYFVYERPCFTIMPRNHVLVDVILIRGFVCIIGFQL